MLSDNAPSVRAEFLRGARDILPIVVATVPFGLVFGTLAAHRGLSLDDSVLMSAILFAGAAQYTALEFWVHPLPFLAILLSVSAVNLRLMLYSAALQRRIGHWSVLQRYLGLGLLSDAIFALAAVNGGERLSAVYYFGLSLPLYMNWIVCSAIGYVFGNVIGQPEAIGLDFVVTAYFIHLLSGFRKRPSAASIIVASALGSVALYLVLGSPWNFAGGAIAGIVAAIVRARPVGASA